MEKIDETLGHVEFRTIDDALAYAAECALASVENLASRKGGSQSERVRARSIAGNLLQAARQHCDWSKVGHAQSRYPRLRLALKLNL